MLQRKLRTILHSPGPINSYVYSRLDLGKSILSELFT